MDLVILNTINLLGKKKKKKKKGYEVVNKS